MSIDQHPTILTMQSDLKDLQKAYHEHALDDEKRFSEIAAKLDTVVKQLGGIYGGLNKIFGVLGSAVLLAIAKWILDGGLTHTP